MNDLAHGTVCGPASSGIEASPSPVQDAKKSTSLLVEIVSDAICPWCFVAKRNFERAVTKLPEGVKMSVRWLPFELNPDMPVEGIDRRAYRSAKFGSWARSQELDAQVSAAAAQAGIRMRHDLMQQTPNTFKAHRLIWLAGQEGVQDAVVETLFGAYFVEGRDVGEINVLVNIAAGASIARERAQAFFSGNQGVAEVSASVLAARRRGISGVPTFMINGTTAFSGAQRPELMLTQLLGAVTPS
jgi:predicted DsbA family dithiol-disulfide isomerase